MIICSALYYPGLLDYPNSLVRDNRFYPAKASQTFGVWWQYLRKHYPDIPVVLFADTASPVPIRPLLEALPEPWKEPATAPLEMWGIDHRKVSDDRAAKVMVHWLSAHAGQYFRPMQRNLVEGIITAYRSNEDLLWIDNDCFCNTDITPLVRGADFAAPQIAHHQQTADSVFTYISSRRLHALDDLGIDLPSFLTTMLNEGPTDTRMHTLQEGGLYKLFAYGDARALGARIELSHLSCYDHFLAFLRRNPLDTDAYRTLVAQVEAVDWAAMPGVERSFWDMLYPENAAL